MHSFVCLKCLYDVRDEQTELKHLRHGEGCAAWRRHPFTFPNSWEREINNPSGTSS